MQTSIFLLFFCPLLVYGSPLPDHVTALETRFLDDIALESRSLDERSLVSSLLNSSAGLMAFLGDHSTVIRQNALLKNDSACADMTVLFARGTAEPGNVGILTGPPFFAALASYMNGTNQLAIQGVDYEASVSGFLQGGSTQGANKMASLINSTMANCPSTALMLSGYSQGAELVHLAAASLPTNVTSQISAVVLFGDPKNGTALNGIDSNKVLTICHTGDAICQGSDKIKLQHLTYGFGNNGADVQMAAMFALGGMAQKGITSARVGRIAVGDRVIG